MTSSINLSSPAASKPLACGFCKKNGETEEFYLSHKLRDENNRITCPVLLEYRCSLCHAKGRHTVSYCPKRKKNNSNLNTSTSSGDSKSSTCIRSSNNNKLGSVKLHQQPLISNQQPLLSQLPPDAREPHEAILSAKLANVNLMVESVTGAQDQQKQNRELLQRTLLDILREMMLGLQVIHSLVVKHV